MTDEWMQDERVVRGYTAWFAYVSVLAGRPPDNGPEAWTALQPDERTAWCMAADVIAQRGIDEGRDAAPCLVPGEL